jgi:HAD superfamily hydrolase (TIGR01509 family)
MKTEIQYLYFDLGNVLFSVDHQSAWTRTLKHCREEAMPVMERFYDWGLIIEHMIGGVNNSQFFGAMKTLIGFQEESGLLRSYWEGVFHPIEERLIQMERLLERHPVGVLSNISPVHSTYLEKCFPIMNRFRHRIYSWEVGFVKPRREIFDRAATESGYLPEQMLFIDDQISHVEQARLLGWNALAVGPDSHLLDELADWIPI